ncbi:divergent polysaccharide deacetylase family protein [Paenibacillus sp. J2TS4]|uniref:divergent polysaccharide deacetylase family protein n=1 Tax=Paenibacillus sp. J2TS4 TaxID=2807194 RepID=UPI001B1B8DF0|nr:divergent polysaccharide deacetylase family protein [Paenibacillus sp. J2TS4]GIP31462.1 hypothetical protein J2TS4_06720 [Paenibacillus sp. J2TS4]
MKRPWGLSLIALLLGLFVNPIWSSAASNDPGLTGKRSAAVVIDDFGNNMKGTDDMFHLPFKITAAIMPFLPSTKLDAEKAHQAGHDVIVHLPMEPISGPKSWLGPGAITTDLTDEEIRRRVHAAIDEVPHAIGLNNHMGSKATSDRRVMKAVLEVCKERGLFFLDSHTNYRSIISKVAQEVGVPCLENHLFLDDVHTRKHMTKQLAFMRQHLSDHTPCIAIGHVGTGGKLMAEVLGEIIPKMDKNIRFVGVSDLFAEMFPIVPGLTSGRDH